jgi:hypothetical protein
MQNMRDLADLATKSTAESAGIIRERIHDNLSEWQDGVSSASGNEENKEASEMRSEASGPSDSPTGRTKKR